MKRTKAKKYRSEDSERVYWSVHDSAAEIDWSKAKRVVFPNLKPTYSSISIRMPSILIEELKSLANRRDIPYQSLMKIFLSDKVKEELAKKY